MDTDTELPNNKPLNPALLTKPLPALKRAELSLTYTMNKVTAVAARMTVLRYTYCFSRYTGRIQW